MPHALSAVDTPARRPPSQIRAGNAMSRTRAALLDGARRAVLTSGTKMSMAQIAASAGIAKGTLYNHFRSRNAVLTSLLDAELDALLSGLADRPLPDALVETALAVSEHPLLRALERLEPSALGALARVDLDRAPWRRAAGAVEELLAGFDRSGTGTVLRWLASFMLSPADVAEIRQDVDVLLAGLPTRLRTNGRLYPA